MNKMLVVALGGAFGAVARFWLSALIGARWSKPFPLATFVINVTGSFIIGFLLTSMSQRMAIHPHWRLLIAVGFIGAYTTFSTFEYETLKLIEEGNLMSAVLNVTLSVVVGFIAVWLGSVAARRLFIPPELALNLQNIVSGLSRSGPKTGAED